MPSVATSPRSSLGAGPMPSLTHRRSTVSCSARGLGSRSQTLADAESIWDAPSVTETIVVGYDGEEPAQRTLERALEEAKAAHARLLIVAVEAMPLDPYAPRTFGTLDDSASPISGCRTSGAAAADS